MTTEANAPARKAPIKVLHVMDKLSVEGSGIHGVSRAVAWWLPRFDPAEFQFHLCSLRSPEPAAEVFAQVGIPVTFLSKSKVDPTTVTALMQVIKREKADVLHLHGYGASNFGRIAGCLKGLPRILHEHAILPNQPFYQTVADSLLSGFTTKAIAISEPVRDFMIEKRKVPAKLIETLFVGVALDEFVQPPEAEVQTARQALGLDGSETVICTLGRLDSEKGHVDLINAAAKVLQGHENVRFLIVGEGPMGTQFKEQAESLGITDKVIFTGYRRDIPVLIALSDIVAIPSLREGGPLVLFEALAMGKAAVGTPVGLIPKVIEDGKSGYLVPIGDADTLAARLIDIVENPEKGRAMGQEGKSRCGPYDISVTVERLAEIYRELAVGGRAA